MCRQVCPVTQHVSHMCPWPKWRARTCHGSTGVAYKMTSGGPPTTTPSETALRPCAPCALGWRNVSGSIQDRSSRDLGRKCEAALSHLLQGGRGGGPGLDRILSGSVPAPWRPGCSCQKRTSCDAPYVWIDPGSIQPRAWPQVRGGCVRATCGRRAGPPGPRTGCHGEPRFWGRAWWWGAPLASTMIASPGSQDGVSP